jgi:beta-galactosidase/beta-glucuronidase
MKQFYVLSLMSFIMFSCSNESQETQSAENERVNQEIEKEIDSTESIIEEEKEQENPDSIFQLDISGAENIVLITNPKSSNFSVPDEDEENYVEEFKDFNGDGLEDVMVYLGACGTGGCMHAIFIKQYENYYKLAFSDYLKGPSFETNKNGGLLISSYEEVDAYDPSKLYVNTFKFNPETYWYELDTNYIYYDTIP